jgi:hypothetical protein
MSVCNQCVSVAPEQRSGRHRYSELFPIAPRLLCGLWRRLRPRRACLVVMRILVIGLYTWAVILVDAEWDMYDGSEGSDFGTSGHPLHIVKPTFNLTREVSLPLCPLAIFSCEPDVQDNEGTGHELSR